MTNSMKPDAQADDRKRANRTKVSQLARELQEMPKPRIDDVAMPVGMQIRYTWLAATLFPFLAGACYCISISVNEPEVWVKSAKILLTLFGVVALIAVVFSAWGFFHLMSLRRLVKGEYFVCWAIPDDLWAELVAARSVRKLWFVLGAMLLSLIAGVSFAGATYGDGNLMLPSVAGHFGLAFAIFVAIGYVLGVFVWKMSSFREQIVRSHAGQAVIGPHGVYRTGEFWAFQGAFQWLHAVSISEDPSRLLTLRIATSAQKTINYYDVLIPFPKEDSQKASALCRTLRAKYARSKQRC